MEFRRVLFRSLPVIAAGRQHHAQPCPDALCACTVSRNDSQDLSVLNDQFDRSEEHTSELQSLMRNSYAVFCLKKKKKTKRNTRQERDIKPILLSIHIKNTEIYSQVTRDK